jgi:PAS domain S-box-containing protein
METPPATLTSGPLVPLASPDSLADACRMFALRFLLLDAGGTITDAWGWNDPAPRGDGHPGRLSDLPRDAAGSTRMWGRILRGANTVLEGGAPEFRISYNADPPHGDRRLAVRVQSLGAGALLTIMDVTGVEQPAYAFHADTAESDAAPWEFDLSSGAITVDPRIKAWLGYGPRELEDSRAAWEGRFLSSDFPLFREALGNLLAGELSVAQIETRLVDRRGRIRWFLMRASLTERDGGSLPKVLGTARDITRIKTTETALAAARKALRRRDRRLRRLTLEVASARLSERKRIARELHDDVCQRLAALEILCSVLLRRLDEPEASLALWEIMSRISALTKDVRQLTHEVSSPATDSEQLIKRLQSYIGDLARITQLQVAIETSNLPPQLPRGLAVTLFRVAQEGLRNVAQHASTDRARVRLAQEDGGLTIQVEDQGRGFDGAAPTNRGFGITSMAERVAELEGQFRLTSALGQGTTLRVWIPSRVR